MNDVLQEFSKSLVLPPDEVIEAFDELKSKGLICTLAESPKDLNDRKYPVRLAGIPPIDSDTPSLISFGPFAMKREHYERVCSAITDPDALKTFLGFARLIYEKTGAAVEGYHFEADEETLSAFLSLIDLWDVEHPLVCDSFVWILPTDDCRQYVEKIVGEAFEPDDFSWWNARLDLGSEIIPTTLNDYPESYGLVPLDLLAGHWAKYLPSAITATLLALYSSATTGGEFRAFNTLTEILEIITQSLGADEATEGPDESSTADRNLLIKELCDFNSLPYPVDAHTAFDYLCGSGFILVDHEGTRVEYSLAKEPPLPEDVLTIPDGWEERVSWYLSTGSILFSYLTIEEIVAD
jgi:hypothetical protein